MSRFEDNLWESVVDRHGEELAGAKAPRARGRGLRPRIVAGSTLGMAGIGAALVLAFSGSSAPPAFAVTTAADGSVLVHINYVSGQDLPQVNAKLAAMGTNEAITIYNASGPATVTGPVTCSSATGAASPSGPTVKVLEGSDGTQVIGAGQSAGNTAEGSFHLTRCVTSSTAAGTTGNSGTAGG